MPTEFNRQTLQRVRRNLFFLLVALTTVAFLGMIRSFLVTVLWAVVLTMIFYGLYQWVQRRVGEKRTGLAAMLAVLLVFLFVIIPFGFLSVALVDQGVNVYEAVQSGELDPTIVVNLVEDRLPMIGGMLEDYGISTDDLKTRLSNFAVEVSQFIANRAFVVGGNIINIFVQFTLMLYLLFFFFKDGKTIMRAIIDTIPMGNVRERALFMRFAQVSKATLKGTLM
ncbi:MAG: AI-2E family transporter, partial [Bacteroidota bacterium]